jgi:Rrf2 family protein
MTVRISARSDYAVRAMLAIAAAGDGLPVKVATLVEAQDMPFRALQGVLQDLRRAGLLVSRLGHEGGYALARPADDISIGDILRATSGTLSTVRGQPSGQVGYHGVATGLHDVWQNLHTAVADVLDRATLTNLLATREGAAR